MSKHIRVFIHLPLFLAKLVYSKEGLNATGDPGLLDWKHHGSASKIIEGSEAGSGVFPWMVALYEGPINGFNYQFCGGSLIAPQIVLTAAHCVYGPDYQNSTYLSANVFVVIGLSHLVDWVDEEYTIDGVSYTPEMRMVSSVILHPDYDDDTFANDIALLRLESASTFPTISLSTSSVSESSTDWCLVAGWGDTIDSEYYYYFPNDLMYTWVPFVDNPTCLAAYETYSPLASLLDFDVMFCAGYSDTVGASTTDSCQGDSGGPAVYSTTDIFAEFPSWDDWQQVGIVSWGDGCADSTYGVYTNVPLYVDWIQPYLSSETSSCSDSTSWHKKNDPSKDCSWVNSLDDKRRCGVTGEDGQRAYQECRVACDTCPRDCESEDSTTWSRSGDSTRDCTWISTFYPARCTRANSEGVYGFETEACPYACHVCTYCEDDSSWSINDQPSKNCDWVATASQSRCGKRGVDAGGNFVYAFQACPNSCRVCSNYGECSDDAGWLKNNEDADSGKNCDWVAAAPLPDEDGNGAARCAVKGVNSAGNSVLAYEACRIACSTC